MKRFLSLFVTLLLLASCLAIGVISFVSAEPQLTDEEILAILLEAEKPVDAAGRLLEAAGCKGLRVGGAYVWEGHANVSVSGPGANASDFLALARLMRNRVLFRFGVALEPEVCGLAVG